MKGVSAHKRETGKRPRPSLHERTQRDGLGYVLGREPSPGADQAGTSIFFKNYLLTLIFWLHYVACGVLVPRSGVTPVPPALEAWSLNHWTSRRVPGALDSDV